VLGRFALLARHATSFPLTPQTGNGCGIELPAKWHNGLAIVKGNAPPKSIAAGPSEFPQPLKSSECTVAPAFTSTPINERNNDPAVKHHASRDQYLHTELTALTPFGTDLRITCVGPACGSSKVGDSTNIGIH